MEFPNALSLIRLLIDNGVPMQATFHQGDLFRIGYVKDDEELFMETMNKIKTIELLHDTKEFDEDFDLVFIFAKEKSEEPLQLTMFEDTVIPPKKVYTLKNNIQALAIKFFPNSDVKDICFNTFVTVEDFVKEILRITKGYTKRDLFLFAVRQIVASVTDTWIEI